VAPTAPRTPIIHHRDKRPESTALINPSPGHGQYLDSGECNWTQGFCLWGTERDAWCQRGCERDLCRPTSGTNTVSVVAKFGNGAKSVVYQGSIG
jgi:hypothetical protein